MKYRIQKHWQQEERTKKQYQMQQIIDIRLQYPSHLNQINDPIQFIIQNLYSIIPIISLIQAAPLISISDTTNQLYYISQSSILFISLLIHDPSLLFYTFITFLFMSMLPLYFIAILTFIYYLTLYGSYLPSFYTFAIDRWGFYKQNSNQQVVNALKELVEAPTVGQFFYQELISKYVLSNQWEKVLNYSKLAVQSSINKNSFSIWYYKATAQCLLNQVEECERSARVANSLCPYNHQDFVSQLFNLAKIMKGNKKIEMRTQNNEITIVIDQKSFEMIEQDGLEENGKNTQDMGSDNKVEQNYENTDQNVGQYELEQFQVQRQQKIERKQINLSEL